MIHYNDVEVGSLMDGLDRDDDDVHDEYLMKKLSKGRWLKRLLLLDKKVLDSE